MAILLNLVAVAEWLARSRPVGVGHLALDHVDATVSGRS